MISLVTMSQGNVIALQRTVASVLGVCDEVIYGDMCIFNEDTTAISEAKFDIRVNQYLLPFNYIFTHGFSSTLNTLASRASNDVVMYLNVGEVISSSLEPIKDVVERSECDMWYIDHATEKHRWWRVYNRKKLEWSGLIHEEVVPIGGLDVSPYHKPLFRFADTDKDMIDPLKARVMNDIKEIVYFEQLMKIVDQPNLLAATSPGWLAFAKDQYSSMQERLAAKGERYSSFKTGNKGQYLNDVLTSDEFKQERFESSLIIEYQGDKKYLL